MFVDNHMEVESLVLVISFVPCLKFKSREPTQIHAFHYRSDLEYTQSLRNASVVKSANCTSREHNSSASCIFIQNLLNFLLNIKSSFNWTKKEL